MNMPVIRVDDATFVDLSVLKTWFGTKTPGETIARAVEIAKDQLGLEGEVDEAAEDSGCSPPLKFSAAPGLSFTKPLAAKVNGKSIRSPRWSAILLSAIAQVKAKGFEGERLVNELAIHSKVEEFNEEGFRFYPDLGISVQGQSASDAWREIDRLATKWGFPVEVEFWWRQNPKAQHPGRTGILRAGPA
jgi:hypothetical protein